MNRAEATELYNKLFRQARRVYRHRVMKGKYPYPRVLDEIINERMVRGCLDLGSMEIPMEDVVGTKTAGRRNAFAAGFLPNIEQGS